VVKAQTACRPSINSTLRLSTGATMQATILDLRRRMPEVLRALDRNERITILHRGRRRAELVPVPVSGAAPRKRLADHPAVGMWADREDQADVAAQVRALRRGRMHAV
jgi:antitoxin (DNA-binding transcriptional repressor) of toxin-antitoxin stability system